MTKARETADLNNGLDVDASGNVGIGTAAPTVPLTVSGATVVGSSTTQLLGSAFTAWSDTGAVAAFRSNEAGTSRALYIDIDNATGVIDYDASGATSGTHTFSTGGSERMRIDASGNLLVGQTSINYNAVGASLASDGTIRGCVDGGLVGAFNRKTSDGTIVNFYKDGTTVGSIGVGGSATYFGRGSTGLGFAPFSETNSSIFPLDTTTNAARDNAIDLGFSSARFDDVYATNGTIQTSDRNEKEAIASLTPTEMLVAARLSSSFKNFKWKDAVAEKGLDAARMHSGIIAQDVQDAFAAEGLDASDYAMFISGTWWETQTDVPAVDAVAEVVDEDGVVVTEAVEAVAAYTRTDTYHTLEEAPEGATERTRLGVRYPELLAFVAAYNDQRFLAIEARLAALETE